MNKVLNTFVFCYLGLCFSCVSGENPRDYDVRSSVRVIPVTGLQFQDREDSAAPYSFYYPYDYGYYYPETFGTTTDSNQECYSRLHNGIFFYYCD